MGSLDELYIQENQRIRYFMIAAAGASLAYALTRTDTTETHTVSDYLWLAAVVVWGVSFATGLLGVERTNMAMNANIRMGVAKAEGHENTMHVIDGQFRRSALYSVWFHLIQKWTLLAGAVFFGCSAIVVRFGIANG